MLHRHCRRYGGLSRYNCGGSHDSRLLSTDGCLRLVHRIFTAALHRRSTRGRGTCWKRGEEWSGEEGRRVWERTRWYGWSGRGRGFSTRIGEENECGCLLELPRGRGGDLSHLPGPSTVWTRGVCPAPCTSRALCPVPPFKLLTRGHQQWFT